MYQFSDFNFKIGSQNKFSWHHCDQCKHNSVLLDQENGEWLCQNCGWRGSLKLGDSYMNPWKFGDFATPILFQEDLSGFSLEWVTNKGISKDSIIKYQYGLSKTWCRNTKRVEECISIPYYMNKELINIKYRFIKSPYEFSYGSELIPYGMDDIKEDCVYFCLNEMEKILLSEVGADSAIALPQVNFKNFKESKVLEEIHNTLSFLENFEDRFKNIKKFILCLGNNTLSKNLEDELGRRLGRERCYIVNWPEEFASISAMFKISDGNNWIINGKERLKSLLETSRPIPVKGVYEIEDVKQQFDELYEKGMPPGPRTGWDGLDDFYRPALGQWTLVTGVPSHGKSNWLDALSVQLSEIHGWKFGIFSPENQPVARHFANISEKFIGKPFSPTIIDGEIVKMNIEEKEKAEKWLSKHYSVILPDDNEPIEGILEMVKSVILRKGIQGVIIDPWNEIDHNRENGMSETEHISLVLSKIRKFARIHGVHIWVVAHPTKMRKNDDGIYPVPTPYDVAGSAHFLNKADFCVCVYRFVGQLDATITDLYIQKVRFKENGIVGRHSLRYIPYIGRFEDDIDQILRGNSLDTGVVRRADEFIRLSSRTNNF